MPEPAKRDPKAPKFLEISIKESNGKVWSTLYARLKISPPDQSTTMLLKKQPTRKAGNAINAACHLRSLGLSRETKAPKNEYRFASKS
jgi:hypothetical protein